MFAICRLADSILIKRLTLSAPKWLASSTKDEFTNEEVTFSISPKLTITGVEVLR
jgi:hypothetical protein